MIFILSTGTSALIYISKKCEISDDVIYVGAAPTWPNLTQPDQTIMRYLMTSYVGAAPITSFSRTSGGKLMETVRGNDWKSLYCNDLLLFFWKFQTFPSSDNTGKKWCYTTGWNSGCGDLVKSQRWLIPYSLLWNIGSRLFIMVRFRQLCYFGQKRPLSCFLSLNFSQVLKQSLELWGLQRRRVGPK